MSLFYSAPVLVGAYQIGAKSMLELNLHGRVALCSTSCRYIETVTTIACSDRYRTKYTAHKCLPVGFETTPPQDPPPLMHAQASAAECPAVLVGQKPVGGRVVDGRILHPSACRKKKGR